MGISPQEQGTVVAPRRAVVTDCLGNGQDVCFVEGMSQTAASVSGGPEDNPLVGFEGVRGARVVGSHQMGDVDEVRWRGNLARAWVVHLAPWLGWAGWVDMVSAALSLDLVGPPGPVRRAGSSHTAPNGGRVSNAEYGWPCHGTSSASTDPRLPTPDPPYCSASVFRISFHRPGWGSPRR